MKIKWPAGSMFLIRQVFFVCTTGCLLSVTNIVSAQTVGTSLKLLKELQDRLTIQDLINAYSHDADRREADQQAGLFTEKATIEIYHKEPDASGPDTILTGRASLKAGFLTLKKYDVTMHFNGQSTIYLNGDSATGEVYCLAHHVWTEDGKRLLMVIGIRYYDNYVRIGQQWFFARRKLIFDWVDKKPSTP